MLLTGLMFINKVASGQVVPDSVAMLKPVEVRAWFGESTLAGTPSAVSIISQSDISRSADWRPTQLLNTVAGVRMEERSPGSYRLSVRGSLLRSPYGVRDVKVYFGENPLTDAGGNTYLGSVDLTALKKIEVIKGPSGSAYGANMGGVLLLDPYGSPAGGKIINIGLSGGSFGLFQQSAAISTHSPSFSVTAYQSFLRTDGYRRNSAMNKQYYQLSGRYLYSRNRLEFITFYSNLNYRTPGGLTAGQMEDDAQQSRPATQQSPGAAEQLAGISNKTIYTGVSNRLYFSSSLSLVLAGNASYTDFRNPFITNYEQRFENTLGLRSYIEWSKASHNSLSLAIRAGIETQSTGTRISNSGNDRGRRDTLQSADRMKANQSFYFLHFSSSPVENLNIRAGLSTNVFGYTFKTLYPTPSDQQTRHFKHEWLPDLAVSYKLGGITVRSSLAKGYSSPTLAEIRPSNNIINQQLEAERGWNAEAGLRMQDRWGRWKIDLSAFLFIKRKAIVRSLDENGYESFVNVGGTRQKGLELSTELWLFRNSHGLLKAMKFNNALTFSHFRFKEAYSGNDSIYGNWLTGIPETVSLSRLMLYLSGDASLSLMHDFSSKQPLNDQNSDWARPYNVFGVQYSLALRQGEYGKLLFSAGADNLFNERYSLGNDINAFGGRYFNPAPGRTFYVSLKLSLL